MSAIFLASVLLVLSGAAGAAWTALTSHPAVQTAEQNVVLVSIASVSAMLRCAGLGCAGLGCAGLGCAGLGCAGLGWAGLGWAGLGWAGLGWAGLGCQHFGTPSVGAVGCHQQQQQLGAVGAVGWCWALHEQQDPRSRQLHMRLLAVLRFVLGCGWESGVSAVRTDGDVSTGMACC
jgi:hypothetical protein